MRKQYPTGGHLYREFDGIVQEIRILYCCRNPKCDLYQKPYNPSPMTVLPYKRFSLAVWQWIGREGRIFHLNPQQIQDRMIEDFGISISLTTIQNCLNELDIYLANQIDQKTMTILLTQKTILLALDGQKPDKEGNALWLFTDLLSQRVLHVSILQNADALTLHTIVEQILTTFHVSLCGLVSDKQNSITAMHDTYYPTIPHQYCHFHFLQNLWNHLEVKDSHLHSQLAKVVNHLYILRVSKQITGDFGELGRQPIRTILAKLEKQLRKVLKGRTKKFENLRGIQAHDRLTEYVQEMNTSLTTAPSSSYLVKLLKQTVCELQEILTQEATTVEECKSLFTQFQKIRKDLGDESQPKDQKIAILDQHFQTIWEQVQGKEGKPSIDDLRSFLPQKDTSLIKIQQEWVRLYYSYRPGLFTYYDFPIPAKTNSIMESSFGEEKGHLIKRSGKGKVGSQIRIRGEYELKQIYAGKEEVKQILSQLENSYEREDIQQGLILLAARQAEESENWQNTGNLSTILDELFKQIKKPEKIRENRSGR